MICVRSKQLGDPGDGMPSWQLRRRLNKLTNPDSNSPISLRVCL